MAAFELPKRGQRGEIAEYEGRHVWMMLFCMLAFVVLLGRLWQLQIAQGEEYHQASTENIIRQIEIRPARGRILDRKGAVLADNRPSFDVYMVPHIYLRHRSDETVDLLKEYLNLSSSEITRLDRNMRTNLGEVVVRRDVTRAQVAMLEEDKLRLPGIEVRATAHRYYPLNTVSSHSIGFVGEVGSEELRDVEKFGYRAGDFIGRMGLERAFEEVLHGSPGIDRRVVDARGNQQGEAQTRFLIGDYQLVKPIPGRDVVSTLDADLTLIIEEAMRSYAAGAVVALDPRDGSVLALYSKPGFNPNAWSGRLSSIEKSRSDNDPFRPMLDKTVSAYFPGSIYKIVASIAALGEGLMGAGDRVHCPGYYQFGGRRFRCWKRGGHGSVNLEKAMQESCDVYYYKVADLMGMDKLSEYAHKFGFGERAGLPVNNESAGRIPTREWHRKNSSEGYQRGFDLNTVLGQGDTLVSPLQAAIAYAAIANGGDIFYPRIVKELRNAEGELLFEFVPRVRKRVDMKPEHLKLLQKSLKKVVHEEGGTAYRVRLADIEVGGKTGTAQVAKIGVVRMANADKQMMLRDHAWFAAYAPFNAPELVVVVFLEHAGHGGAEAAPVAMRIIEDYFNRDRVSALGVKVGEEAMVAPQVRLSSAAELEAQTSQEAD
ncbi:MAG: penicillin-binding protein 2 [Bradymonadaceae bacterium]|nr:penicillin-binding protein 2 [Lujinxingiaceae bacterium]